MFFERDSIWELLRFILQNLFKYKTLSDFYVTSIANFYISETLNYMFDYRVGTYIGLIVVFYIAIF